MDGTMSGSQYNTKVTDNCIPNGKESSVVEIYQNRFNDQMGDLSNLIGEAIALKNSLHEILSKIYSGYKPEGDMSKNNMAPNERVTPITLEDKFAANSDVVTENLQQMRLLNVGLREEVNSISKFI